MSRRWVVIANEHFFVRAMLKQVIDQQQDLEVVGEAEDGQGALDLCRGLRPDVVLIDVQMPKVDGIEATRQIKREFPSIGVLVLTTLESPDCLLEALEAGAAGYILRQHASPQQISDAVRGVLIGEHPLDEEMTIKLLRRMTRKARKEET